MTVDVEDYFHASAFDRVVSRTSWSERESRVVGNTAPAARVVRSRTASTRTFFVLGWVAERFPALVREIAARGHEIASHGFHHQLIYTLTPRSVPRGRAPRQGDDRGRRRAAPCAATGRRVSRSCESSLWALDVLIEEGYTYDASIFPIHHDRYGIPDAPRHAHRHRTRRPARSSKCPASTVRVGGDQPADCRRRLLPAAAVRAGRGGASRASTRSSGEPVVFYIHPWEIDPDQPRLPVSAG